MCEIAVVQNTDFGSGEVVVLGVEKAVGCGSSSGSIGSLKWALKMALRSDGLE